MTGEGDTPIPPVRQISGRASQIVQDDEIITAWLSESEAPTARRITRHFDALGRHVVLVIWGSICVVEPIGDRAWSRVATELIQRAATRRTEDAQR